MVHLKVAQSLLACNNDIKDISAFYKGSLAPDSIMFRQGCQRSDKELTHFCVGGAGWGYYTNYDDWENNLKHEMKNYKGKINGDFLLGYFAHVYTDILYTKHIWTPNRLMKNDRHMEKYADDCYEIDSRLLENFDNKEHVWSLLKDTKNYCLPDIMTNDDMIKLTDAMMINMYYNRISNQSHEFNVITISDMLEFIEKAVEKLNEQYADFFIS